MKISVTRGDIAQTKVDAIIVNLFEGVKKPGGGTGAVDQCLDGAISDELSHTAAFKGKLGETWIFNTYGNLPARYVIVTGLGKSDELDSAKIRRAAAAAIRACQRLKVETAASIVHGAGIGGYDVEGAARLTVEGTLLGAYKFDKRKQKKADDPSPELKSLILIEHDAKKLDAVKQGAKIGEAIANSVNATRDLVFDSPNNVTPATLRDTAKGIEGLTVHVLERKDLEKQGMGAFLSVAKGSEEPPYLIHLCYQPSKKKAKKKVALVGKGITFDSGGLSLKPPQSQETMKMDMAGAAAVLGTMKAIAELGNLDIQVDGFVATCENMPSGRASKPGDIVKTMNGKTVEILNTDAEGRLILVDTLTYAQKTVNPDEIIDLATLTGACVITLGEVASGLMASDQTLADNLIKAGKPAGEKFWQLPLYDEFQDMLKSDVADLKNIGARGQAGTSSAGMFLKNFVDEGRKWAHLDIAGPAYTSSDQPEVPKGATGVGVRTLLYYLYRLS